MAVVDSEVSNRGDSGAQVEQEDHPGSSSLLFGLSSEDFDLDTIEEDLARFREDDVVRDALGAGVDLRQYAAQVDRDLKALQAGSVPSFVEEAPFIADIHAQISECDGALAGMEQILQGFQQDLGGISDEIRHLQDQSLSMNTHLKNRRQVEELYVQVLEKVVVSDALIVGICSGEVNEDYVLYVQELEEKLQFVRGNEEGPLGVAPSDVLAVREVEPQLDRLRLKAVAKLRTFLLSQIANLKRPKTNVQMLQQNVLLKYKYFMAFLNTHAPSVAEEVRATYVDAMSRVLHNLFKSYWTALIKLQRPGPGKEDTIAVEESLLSTCATCQASLFLTDNEARLARLAKRMAAMGEPDAMPLIAHVARSRGETYDFEALFRSVQKHLMDSATSEYLFVLDFFDASSSELFNQVFAKTLSLCLERVENYLYTCHDALALLLMLRNMQAHRLIMQRRLVPCLDGYFDHVNMMLWPEFKRVFDANLRGVQNALPAKLGAAKLTLKPHYVSGRYAQFVATVTSLSASLGTSDDMLTHNLTKLRQAFLALLDKLVAAALLNRQHHRVLSTAKGRLIFRINNLDVALTALGSTKTSETQDGKDLTAIEELLGDETNLYIEEELGQTFGPMLDFLKKAELSTQNDSQGQQEMLDSKTCAGILRDFSTNWRSNVEMLNSSVLNHFTNSDNARHILQQLLTQFLLYYTRFSEIVQKHPDRSLLSSLVSIQEIMNEMKSAIKSP